MRDDTAETPIVIRRATPNDVDAIARFQQAMARETEEMTLDPVVLRKGITALFSNPALGHYWVAEAEGDVIASLMITFEWSDWRNRMVWWIQSVWVEEPWRRKGVYAALYRNVRELAENDAGVGGIRLYVDRRNTRAQQVYRRMGMNGEHYLTFEWMKGQ
ncbi:MAG TPA: GNAT family N-acetyltransferase [Thermoanaerobaculia bacterium]|nr:GNAT family N-acetyltransferase [Thermoanaerobaculia bacterium]